MLKVHERKHQFKIRKNVAPFRIQMLCFNLEKKNSDFDAVRTRASLR